MFGNSTHNQRAFYTGGNSEAVAHSHSTNREIINTPATQTSEFRTAFNYFLLHFSLNGESIYKDQIRRLELLTWRRLGEQKDKTNLRQQTVPSMCLDLEHLNMPHWLPNQLQETSSTQQTHASYPDDTASQLSEEDSMNQASNGYRSTNIAVGWGELLTNAFRQHPLRYLEVAEQCIRELYLELLSPQIRADYFSYRQSHHSMGQFDRGINEEDINVSYSNSDYSDTRDLALFQLELISRQKCTRIRELNANSVETLVTLPGIVVQAYRPQHKAVQVKIRCKQCESEQWLSVPLWRQGVDLPKFCSVGGSGPIETRCPVDPYIILSDESDFCDVQTIKIQELPEQVPTGDMPRHLVLNAANALCGRVVPGERILIVGVFSVLHKINDRGKEAMNKSDAVQSSYIHVLGITFTDKSGFKKSIPWTFKEEEEYQIMARDPNIQDKIYKSIAPSLFGLEDIKKSVACLLFGGSRKCLPDGTRLRGDINILLLGDPSTAKSQFLKFVEKAAPIAIYTSGKGSSAAGLTAAVIRDSNKNFALEGGAMVLADGGVVCIDEFDKMRDDDRVAIHEAMEQQTISIAKAGITTILKTRCSVLAAANPSFGSYDDSKDTTEQHDFETTILSRFDLIWLVRDAKDAEKDKMIARHIIELHSGSGRTVQADGPISVSTLRNYINYCRSVCDPVLSEDGAKKLENYYVEVRESMRHDTRKRRDQIPVTVRQLESLCRIAESLAKMTLSRFVTSTHIEEAIQLFKLSTVEAAKSSLARENLTDSEKERVRSAEGMILQRLPVNGRASKASIIRDMKCRGFETMYTTRALRALILKGTLEERGDASVKRVSGE